MGLLRSIQRFFEKTESLELKNTQKAIHARFRDIEAMKNPADRLQPFRELKADVDKIFDLHKTVDKASGKPDKSTDGWTAAFSLPAVGAMCYGFLSLLDGTSMPLLASSVVISSMFAVTGVLGLAALATGHFVIKRHRAKHLGLTASDVKHAKKLKHTQGKLECHINKIDAMDDTREHLDSVREKYVREKYNALSAKPKKAQDDVAAAAQTQTPAAEVKPTIKEDPAVSEIKQFLDGLPPQRKKSPSPS